MSLSRDISDNHESVSKQEFATSSHLYERNSAAICFFSKVDICQQTKSWEFTKNHNSIKNSLEVGNQTKSIKELKRIKKIIKGYLRAENTKIFTGKIEEGYCIKTKARIPLNPKKPISYTEWFRTNDRNGRYCHKCSEKSETNLDSPMCGGEVCKND